MDNRDTIEPGQRVQWAIAHSGRTAVSIAKEIGVSHATLSQGKHGSTALHRAKVSFVLAFCRATGVHVEWLLTGNGPRLSAPEALDEPALVLQARHIVQDLSPDVAAMAARVLLALEGRKPPQV
jgi:transcriptional regulator with XRE-family HTH domain